MRATSPGFRARVYAIVNAIPAGRVMGYGHVASALGAPGMARQVGWALAALPADTDVPWQRVVRSSGQIAAQGAPGRSLLQRALLEAEGVTFLRERIDMALFGLAADLTLIECVVPAESTP
jgi:methylated-DNA-protein-cysteine methyltransferase-like protein